MRRYTTNSLQKLWYSHPYSPGTPFFLPPGARLFQKLAAFVRAQTNNYGFQEVVTPQLYRKELWQISGHWEHYKDDMFGVCDGHGHNVDGDAESEVSYSLKPMNCPGHCLLFKSQERSFRDLPIKFSDLSPLHRNEASGALSGLTRVRRFHQDDGHIFCTQEQVRGEIEATINLISSVYTQFGLDFNMTLSTRPSEFSGPLDIWARAEQDLKAALDTHGSNWTINQGDGAFYGPKIDFIVQDNTGKSHQTATIQLDFNLPNKFALEYDGADQQKHTPVMIHRAIFGSFERFIAMLIDHYQGVWPFWLNPRQAVVLPVGAQHHDYAAKITAELKGQTKQGLVPMSARNFDVELMAQAEPLGKRLRQAAALHPNFVLVVGDKEVASHTVSVKRRGSKDSKNMSLNDLVHEFKNLEDGFL